MQKIVDILERRVAAAVALIGALRERAAALEEELAGERASASAAHVGAGANASVGDQAASAELERLRAERAVVRERIRALIREIDRVSW